MTLSRSDIHQTKKLRRKRRLKRLLIMNCIMLLLIMLFAGLLYANQQQWWQNKATDSNMASELPGNEQAANDELNNDVPKNDGTDEDTLPADGGQGVEDPPLQPVDEPQAVDSEEERVLLAFVGDILLAGSVERLMEANGYDYPYAQSLSYLADADLTAGNLENPITERGTPAKNKAFVFKGSPKSLPAFRDAGFDVVSLANNHTLDQGLEGLFDTMAHLDEAGIRHTGAGKDDVEAFTPAVLEAKGMKVAYIGLSRVVPEPEWKADKYQAGVAETYDTTRALAAISKAKEEADIVVVLVHWGEERSLQPLAYQKQYARDYIDAGADIIIGAHPHVLQGFEQYKGKWIAYSLGNFIFNVTTNAISGDTGVLDAQCNREGDCSLRFHPMRAEASQPAPMESEQAADLLQRLNELSFGVELDEYGNLTAVEP